jgi:hypothetical protein
MCGARARVLVVTARFTRRTMLAAAALAPVSWGRDARAIGPRSEVSIGHVRHGGAWNRSPEAIRRLLWEAGKRTSIQVARDEVTVDVDAEELFWQPLLALTGQGPMPPWSTKARDRLERHLRFGGMLHVDAPSPGDPFVEDATREIKAVLGGIEPRLLAADHVLYKSFFLLEKAEGRNVDDTALSGVEIGGRAAVVVTKNDLYAAYERDRFGTWVHECAPGGEPQRERAFRMGVNILMYATCLDYKSDQVHIPFIMKKKRR